MRWRRRNPFGRRNPLSAAEESELESLLNKGFNKSASDNVRISSLRRKKAEPMSAAKYAGDSGYPFPIGPTRPVRPLSVEDWAGMVKPTAEEKKAAKKAKVSASAVAAKGKGRNKTDLLREAKFKGLKCRSNMSKPQLAAALVKQEYLGKPAQFGGRAKPWECSKTYEGYRTHKMLAAEAEDLGLSLKARTGPRAGKKKSPASLKRAITKALKRKNPWWNGLLGNGNEEDSAPIMSNPRGRSGMAKKLCFNRGSRYSFGGPRGRKLSVAFSRPKKKKSKKRKNPIDINQPMLGGVSVKDLAIIGGALTGLDVIERAVQSYGLVDLTGFGRFGAAAGKLVLGLGGALVAENAGVLDKGSQADRMVKLSAVAAALMDIARGVSEKIVGPVAQALGLGEIIAHPASTGQVQLTSALGELSYNPYAMGLGAPVGPDGAYFPGSALGQIYSSKRYGGFGEVVANQANTGFPVIANQLGYASDQYGDPMSMSGLGGLAGTFYAGNVSTPPGVGEHPDFMNQVPGRSDLSAVPDFMR